ncbi:hypothetical protein BGZ74_002668 [Mortierella antarctica]|nr:hypothetical protein BGZ74_002668 [Mortierella antarctica]
MESEGSHVRRPLQQDDGEDQQQPPQYQEQHYNIMVPTINHWPQLAFNGLAKGTALAVEGVSTAHSKFQAYRAQRNERSYQGLPTSSSDLHLSPRSSSTSPSSSFSFSSRRDPRKPASFGGKRQLKRGGVCLLNCSGRRLLQLVIVVAWTVFLLVQLPQTLNPFQETLWVRYYNHEEAVKVALPLGRKVHVSDVKAAAMTAMSYGYGTTLGQTKLLSATTGEALSPGAEWDNDKKTFRSSAEKPILAIEVNYGLYGFLDEQLGCFSRDRQSIDITGMRFLPPRGDWTMLVEVLQLLNQNNVRKIMRAHIRYLRQGFNDPRARGPYDMESIYSHRKTPYSGYMPSHHNRTWDPMDSWVMHDEDAGVTAPRSIMNWTPEDEELTREITRQEELGNKEKARELMTELNKQNREKGIDFEYYTPGEDDW